MIRSIARKIFRTVYGKVNPHGLIHHDQQGLIRRLGLPRITNEIQSHLGSDILNGPFVGMHYLSDSYGSALCPKLLGTYEEEIQPFLDLIMAIPYATLIDVGSAEGYYAVGFARRFPNLQVEAFDISPNARVLCKKLARMNGVESRINVRGACSPEALAPLLTGRELIICDCEGYELSLFDFAKAPKLADVDVLVECHDHVVPGITDTLMARFSATHAVHIAITQLRNPATVPSISFLSPEDQRLAVDELRYVTQHWLYLQSHASPLRA